MLEEVVECLFDIVERQKYTAWNICSLQSRCDEMPTIVWSWQQVVSLLNFFSRVECFISSIARISHVIHRGFVLCNVNSCLCKLKTCLSQSIIKILTHVNQNHICKELPVLTSNQWQWKEYKKLYRRNKKNTGKCLPCQLVSSSSSHVSHLWWLHNYAYSQSRYQKE